MIKKKLIDIIKAEYTENGLASAVVKYKKMVKCDVQQAINTVTTIVKH